jgi:hypothetical protein
MGTGVGVLGIDVGSSVGTGMGTDVGCGHADPELLVNMLPMLFPVRSQQRSWLKAEAKLNMEIMFLTLLTFHAPRSWLKAEALWNMYDMSVTLLTSHAPRSWLKTEA